MRPQARRRKANRAAEFAVAISNLAHSEPTLDFETVSNIASAWKRTNDPKLQKALLKTYTVEQLYAIVIEIARETLTKKKRAEFQRRGRNQSFDPWLKRRKRARPVDAAMRAVRVEKTIVRQLWIETLQKNIDNRYSNPAELLYVTLPGAGGFFN